LVSGPLLAGLIVIGIGTLLTVAGLVMLIRAVSQAEKSLRVYATGAQKGPIGDVTELVKALTELIKVVGVARGVPLAVMILGVVLIVIGAGIITVSA
jgi:hypothetical protein